MKKIILPLLLIGLMACQGDFRSKRKIKYPKTKKVDKVDTYFDVLVTDPYRWLEDDNSDETKQWVRAQNKITFGYLGRISFRPKLINRLTEMWNYEKFTLPSKKNNRYFFYRNNGLQNQSILYTTENIKENAKILLDPNTLSKDGTVALASTSISKDGKYLAYSISRGGSDWNEILVRDIKTGKDIEDHIKWVKFSGIAWHGNGFYYGRYDEPKEGTALTTKNEFQKIYFHKIGTKQEEDILIKEDKKRALRMFYTQTTDDEKYLVLYEENAGSKGNALHVKDLTKKDSKFITLIKDFDYEFGVMDNTGSKLLVKTNWKAPRNRVICIDVNKPERKNWKEIIPHKKNVLKYCSKGEGKLVAVYMKDAHSKVEIYNEKGKYESDLELPALGTIGGINFMKDEKIAYYSFSSFTYPSVVYRYNLKTKKSKIIIQPKLDFNADDYITKQIFYTSKDGTKIPMFIVHKKDLKMNGKNPTLLYGYGGFNVSLTPYFKASRLVWLENGGVFAMANLRGGGEYGQKWHEAGMKLNKQNVFDDFITAAEYLIDQKYTSSKKLAIQGGSNGGLLVGAVTNQRPDLFAVALPAVGVMDMLRFHKFTIGWNWITDYGSSNNEEDFYNLIKYSPIHTIKDDIEYPAVLVTTADHDDRVVPAHSFKYISTLQEKYKGKNPVMIRIETQAGHGAGKPTSKRIQEAADIFSFTLYNMKEKYKK